MKILVISSVHRWNDNRIFHKEVKSISKKYSVSYHAVGNVWKKKNDNIEIFGVKKFKYRVLRIYNHLILFNRIFKSKAPVVHFHDFRAGGPPYTSPAAGARRAW